MPDLTPHAVTTCHDLLLWIIPAMDRFSGQRRFTLGERLESSLLEVLEVLESLTEAAYSAKKSVPLYRANLRLPVARHLWRLAYE